MKKSIFILLLFISVFRCNTPTPVNDFSTTADFYNSLIVDEEIDVAKLNLFFTNMPKGGDIHHHYSGSIYAETYLAWVKIKGWKIDSCTLKIISDTSKKSKCKSLTTDEVIQNSTVYRKLLELWSDKDYSNHYHGEVAPDQSFFNTFTFFGKIAHQYVPRGLKILKERAIKENVIYLETMLSVVGVYSSDFFSKDTDLNTLLWNAKSQSEVDQILEKIDKIYLPNKDFNATIDEFVNNTKANHKGIDTDEFTMRFQTYAVRVLPPLQVYTDLLSGFLATEKSSLIVGVNIVAPENNYTALKDYTLHMRMYNYLNRKYPKVNRALHAGELTIGMVKPVDLLFHINEAIDIAKAQRIGHGVDLPYESESFELLNKLKENAAVEINLTSNQFILGVEGNEHPYLIYSSYDVPLVICTDDSGVSRDNLTHEYVLLASRYQPSYETIKEYTYNSIQYSFLTDDDKEKSRATLDAKFKEFESEIAALAKKFK
ncbi:MAG: adenosine deaminase [Saprospiraceae bacterium]